MIWMLNADDIGALLDDQPVTLHGVEVLPGAGTRVPAELEETRTVLPQRGSAIQPTDTEATWNEFRSSLES